MQLSYDAARDVAWITAGFDGAELNTLVAKLDVDAGAWDPAFGGGDGALDYDATGSNGDDYGSGIVAAGDGSAFVLSYDAGTNEVHVRRVSATGVLDAEFASSGTWTSPGAWSSYQYRGKLSMDRDGRVTGLADTTLFRFETTTIPDFAAGTDDWSSATGLFGACLASVAGAAVDGTTWAVDGGNDCLATNADAWNPIVATSASGGSKVAFRATPGTATVALRFGLRVPADAPAGSYVAPIRFDVLAPNAP